MPEKKRILVVDDEVDISRLLKMSLEVAGDYIVQTEGDSTKATATARAFAPDLIILDLLMPKKDGGEVLLEIREDDNLRRTPVVFLTASIEEGSEHATPTLFGYPCMKKPVAVEDLLETIDAALAPGG